MERCGHTKCGENVHEMYFWYLTIAGLLERKIVIIIKISFLERKHILSDRE